MEIAISILGIIVAISIGIYGKKKSVVKSDYSYSDHENFVNRIDDIKEILDSLTETTHMNIYGKSGIGKRALLKHTTDIINGKIGLHPSCVPVTYKNNSSISFYMELDNLSLSDLKSSLIQHLTGHNDITISEAANMLLANNKSYIHIVIMFGNSGLFKYRNQIDMLITEFSRVSQKFKFVTSTNEKMIMYNPHYKTVHLIIEGLVDPIVKAYIQTKNNEVSELVINDLVQKIDGNPLFMQFYSNNSYTSEKISKNISVPLYLDNQTTYELFESFIKEVYAELNDKDLYVLSIISFLSVSLKRVDYDLLSNFANVSKKTLDALENKSLISNDNDSIYMHEIITDIINIENITNDELLRTIYNTLDSMNMNIKIFFAFFSTKADSLLVNNHNDFSKILDQWKNDSQNELLISLGSFFNMIWKNRILDKKYFSNFKEMIVSNYIHALLEVGDYMTARKIYKIYRINLRNYESHSTISLSINKAHLEHLQHNYLESINEYNILITFFNTNSEFLNKHIARCYYGIAHCHRHIGESRQDIELNYESAISLAKKYNNYDIILKSYMELITYNLALNNYSYSYEMQFDKINAILGNINPESSLKYAVMKVKARYYRLTYFTIDDGFELLNESNNGYERIRKRLQYNAFFDLGEYYQKKSQYSLAIDNYKISMEFSIHNGDSNIYIMSCVGIIITEILSNNYVVNSNISEQKEKLNSILEIAYENNLIFNYHVVKLLISYIDGTMVDYETIQFFSANNYLREVFISTNLTRDNLQNLHLILM